MLFDRSIALAFVDGTLKEDMFPKTKGKCHLVLIHKFVHGFHNFSFWSML